MAESKLRSIERLFAIIGTIDRHGAIGVSEASEHLDMAKSTVHDHLTTLHQEGFLLKDGDDRYQLGLEFLSLGGSARRRTTNFSQIEPVLTNIASDTGESVIYVVQERGELVGVGSVLGDRGIRSSVGLGFRAELSTVPEGRLLLAFLPQSAREEYIDELNFPVAGFDSRPAFVSRLDELRSNGWVVGRNTVVDNVTSVSVPVCNNAGTLYGAVVVATPSPRGTEKRTAAILGVVEDHLSHLSVNLTYDDAFPAGAG